MPPAMTLLGHPTMNWHKHHQLKPFWAELQKKINLSVRAEGESAAEAGSWGGCALGGEVASVGGGQSACLRPGPQGFIYRSLLGPWNPFLRRTAVTHGGEVRRAARMPTQTPDALCMRDSGRSGPACRAVRFRPAFVTTGRCPLVLCGEPWWPGQTLSFFQFAGC